MIQRFETSNKGRGGDQNLLITPEVLVLHHTAGLFEGDVSWICNPQSKVSYHCLVGEKAQQAQFMHLKNRAWHAGKSEWKGRSWLNNWSIGFAFSNYGKLTESGKNLYKTKAGFVVKLEIDDVQEFKGELYHRYSNEQIEVGRDWVYQIVSNVGTIKEIVTHYEVSPGRKDDPSPVFPLDKFRNVY